MRIYEYQILDFDCALHAVITGCPKDSMNKWEDNINDLAKEGWRLVGLVSPPMAILGMSTFVRLFFERVKTSPADRRK